MGVQNHFTNNGVNIGEKLTPGEGLSDIQRLIGRTAILAADDDTSTYLLGSLSSSFRPFNMTVMCDAITGGTDYDLGLYNPVTGLVVDKDLFMDGQTLASASRVLNGMSAIAIENIGKTIAELLSLNPSTALPYYDLVLTANTAGTAAGDVVVIADGLAA